MEEAKFTWLPKFTKTLLSVPEEHQAALFRALAQYGNYGIEPEFDDWALKAVFESLREDIDNNKSFRNAGSNGGRGNKKRGSAERSKGESPLSDTANPPSENDEEPETPLCGDSETEKRGSEKSPSIPYQSIPYQSIPSHTKPKERERAPKAAHGSFSNVMLTDDELRKLKERFPDWEQRIDDLSAYMASKGKRYKSHYATLLTWARRDERPKEGVRDEYSDL